MSKNSLTIADTARQRPLADCYHKSSIPPKTCDHFLSIDPFREWLKGLMKDEGLGTRELASLIQLNERSIRRLLGTPEKKNGKILGPQKTVSIDLVDWALTRADGCTQLWHLYPELYDHTGSDIEIFA